MTFGRIKETKSVTNPEIVNQFGESAYSRKMRISVYTNAQEYNENYEPTNIVGVLNLKKTNADTGECEAYKLGTLPETRTAHI